MTRLVPTPVPDVSRIWPRIRRYIVRAMKRSDGWWTEKELKERAFLGQIAVWQIKDGDRIGPSSNALNNDILAGFVLATFFVDDGTLYLKERVRMRFYRPTSSSEVYFLTRKPVQVDFRLYVGLFV